MTTFRYRHGTIIFNQEFGVIFGSPTAVWHWWFAWRPVRLEDSRIVWLQGVARLKNPSGYSPRRKYMLWHLHVEEMMRLQRDH